MVWCIGWLTKEYNRVRVLRNWESLDGWVEFLAVLSSPLHYVIGTSLIATIINRGWVNQRQFHRIPCHELPNKDLSSVIIFMFSLSCIIFFIYYYYLFSIFIICRTFSGSPLNYFMSLMLMFIKYTCSLNKCLSHYLRYSIFVDTLLAIAILYR